MLKCQFTAKNDFLTFLMPITPWKQSQNTKIRSLLQTKLFKIEEWKWHHFCYLVTFWWWKSSLKKLNFRALAINGFWTKKTWDQIFWLFLMKSNPSFIRFEIENHWLPLFHIFRGCSLLKYMSDLETPKIRI